MDVNRRTLLKVISATAAGSALPGCEREVHRLVPYLLPDDEIIPGVAHWYASVCGECDAGCGIVVRVMEGRAKKIEGNPDHPVNRGKLCARGQAAVQNLYHPDRLKGPMKREGPRGDGRFVPITWDEGLALWMEQLRKYEGASAMLSKPLTGSLHSLCSDFFNGLGGRLLYYDPSDALSLLTSMQVSFGMDYLPRFNLADSDYVLSFGAPFLDHWLSPVWFGAAYGKMRRDRPSIRGRFVQIEPRLSLTAANADRWIPIRPGTEGLLALGIGALLLEQVPLTRTERDAYKNMYGRYHLDDIARTTEVPRETIIELAENVVRADAPLAIGGGLAAAHTNGTASLIAVNTLNVLAGKAKRSGLQWHEPPGFPYRTSPPRPESEQALSNLAADFEEGRRSLLHLYRSNPLYTCPPSLRIERLFRHARYTVSFSSFLDDSTAMADLLLPDHAPLESWGDDVQRGLVPEQVFTLQQPVVSPLYDTRALGDVIFNMGRELGHRSGQDTPSDFQHLVQENWKQLLADKQNAAESGWFDSAWVEHLQRGGRWSGEAAPLAVHPRPPVLAYEPAQFAGDGEKFPFWFLPYPSSTLRRDGAHLPWLQELPDPLTTVVWGSWIEMNPLTARQNGIKEGDLVKIESSIDSLEAPVIFTPGLRPDAVAMPIGQGHRRYGRYAQNRGVNPLTILAPLLDARSGTLASCATRVRVEPTGRKGQPVLIDHRSVDERSDNLRI